MTNQERLAKQLMKCTAEEAYETLGMVMLSYASQFTDSRLAVIEWLKCEKDGVKPVLKELDRPHGEWIPVSERLPEEDGEYLVCWCGAWGVDICFAEYSKCGKYWHEKYGGEYRGITAWMPLPEPYQKEGDAE